MGLGQIRERSAVSGIVTHRTVEFVVVGYYAHYVPTLRNRVRGEREVQ